MESDRELEGARCEGCVHFEARGTAGRCAGRGVRIESPKLSFCANHPGCGGPASSVPVGPVLVHMDGRLCILFEAPDSTAIRSALIAIVDESDKRRVSDLTPHEEIALWQLVQWRERRAFVLRDKIEGEPMLLGEPSRGSGAAELAERRPVGRFVSAARRARVATWLLAVDAAVALALVGSGEMQIDLLERAIAGEAVTIEVAHANDVRHGAIALVDAVARIATTIAFLVWIHRAYANLRPLGARDVRHSPVWAVVAWFVPIANLVLPYTVVRETAEKSAGPEHAPMTGLVLGWWLTFLAMSFCSRGAAGLASSSADVRDLLTATRVEQVAACLSVGAALLAILVVRGIERRQASRPDILAAFD